MNLVVKILDLTILNKSQLVSKIQQSKQNIKSIERFNCFNCFNFLRTIYMVNAIQKIPITAQGVDKLREELQHLKTVARPMVIKAISDARSNGDLKENADYHAAREQQAFIEGRILDLENKLSNCQVIDIKKISNDGKIIFGTTVTLLSVDDKLTKEVVYQIVGDDEADLKLGKLSVNSPLAKALIGKYEGDEVNVNAPSGIVTYEVMKVEYI